MTSSSLTILVDHRERDSGVPDALRLRSTAVVEANLPLADYIVASGIGVERKTVGDLHRSILEGRLWSQVASLRCDLSYAFLLVEGRDIDRGPLSPAGIRGALLEVASLGIPVLRSTDPEDTALWLIRLAARITRGSRLQTPRRTRPRQPATPASLLSSIPGVSPHMAKVLLTRFGSVAAVGGASESALTAVPGIGAARARMIRDLLSRG